MEMSALISKMVIFVTLMVAGYVFARSGRAGKDFAKAASSLLMNLFLCATILNSVVTTDTELSGGDMAHVLLVLTVAVLMCYALAIVAAKIIPTGGRNSEFTMLLAVPNNMFIALPVIESICGPIGVFYCSLTCIPFNIMLYTYGVWKMKDGKEGSLRLKDILSVPLVATFAALIIFLVKLPVPGVIKDLLSAASGATMPLSMIVIGASLGSVNILAAFKDWRFYVADAVRLIITPLLALLVCGFITTNWELLMTAFIMAAAPSGVMVTVLALQYGKDEVFASEGILHSTAVSMLTIPLLVYFFA